MRDVPGVRVLAADPRQIRPVALGAPLERMVVHALGGERRVAVTLDLVAEGADHLAVAARAAFANVDVAARELERRIWAHAVDGFERALEIEERSDLDHGADSDHDKNADDEIDRVGPQALMPGEQRPAAVRRSGAAHGFAPLIPPAEASAGRRAPPAPTP